MGGSVKRMAGCPTYTQWPMHSGRAPGNINAVLLPAEETIE